MAAVAGVSAGPKQELYLLPAFLELALLLPHHQLDIHMIGPDIPDALHAKACAVDLNGVQGSTDMHTGTHGVPLGVLPVCVRRGAVDCAMHASVQHTPCFGRHAEDLCWQDSGAMTTTSVCATATVLVLFWQSQSVNTALAMFCPHCRQFGGELLGGLLP
jgi:hypothetical protein